MGCFRKSQAPGDEQRNREEQLPVPGYVIWACVTGGLDLERKMKYRKPTLGV